MNGHVIPLAGAFAAYFVGTAIPAELSPIALSSVVAILCYMVLDLRREQLSLRKDVHRVLQHNQWLQGAVDIIAPLVPGAKIPQFKVVDD